MRKILLALVLILPLTGCSTLAEGIFGLPTGILTQSTQNPVTKKRLNEIESGMALAAVGLNKYRDNCLARRISYPSCYDNLVILQPYVTRAKPLIKSLRRFVRNNDQVNARVIYDELVLLIADFRGKAVAMGVM
jgi:hypothetical protein